MDQESAAISLSRTDYAVPAACSHGYTIRLARPEEVDTIDGMMQAITAMLEQPDTFVADDRAFIEEVVCRSGFGLMAWTAAGDAAGFLLVSAPGPSHSNLGRDLGLEDAALSTVIQMESVAVLPAHRGHRLEKSLLLAAHCLLDELPSGQLPSESAPASHTIKKEKRICLATVSPYNPASLKSFQDCGYEILMTKEKYGGHLRHILGRRG